MTDTPTEGTDVTLTVRRQDLLGPVLARVIGMVAARAHCPVDRLDDALLLSDAIAAHAPAQARNGSVTVRVRSGNDGLTLHVGGLSPDGPKAVLEAASLPGVGNAFERVASTIDTGGEELRLHLAFGS